MNKQNEQFKWKEQKELFEQAVSIEKGYGNYDALFLPDGHYVILDRSNSKFLLPSSGSFYTLPFNWEQWLERGFIVISFHTTSNYTKYYVFSARSKKFITEAIKIDATVFLLGKSDYFIVTNDDLKQAIFDKNGKQVSDWFDSVIVLGRTDYYIAINYDKGAIFHKSGKRISDWFETIYVEGSVKFGSGYYIASNNGKKAIFHRSGKQISDWFDDINDFGLVKGHSDYYVARKNGKEAIFHKNGQQISDWFDEILSVEGLVRGQSDYYWVRNNGEQAIFHKNGERVTDWFVGDIVVGVLEGQSEYYVVSEPSFEDEDDDYYIYKLGSKKYMGPFKGILDYGFITDSSRDTVVVKTSKYSRKVFTKQELDDYFKDKEVEDER
jgi:hypothetical protein